MYYCNFGEILKNLRKTSGLTQKKLGENVGLSKAVVSKYENGLGYPTFDTLIRIAKYFGVSTDFLLGAEKGKTIDVSELTNGQIEAVQRMVSEFITANKKVT